MPMEYTTMMQSNSHVVYGMDGHFVLCSLQHAVHNRHRAAIRFGFVIIAVIAIEVSEFGRKIVTNGYDAFFGNCLIPWV